MTAARHYKAIATAVGVCSVVLTGLGPVWPWVPVALSVLTTAGVWLARNAPPEVDVLADFVDAPRPESDWRAAWENPDPPEVVGLAPYEGAGGP